MTGTHKEIFVFSAGYTPRWPGHVFPTHKYRRLHQKLIREGITGAETFLEPQIATREQLLRVHLPGYVAKLESLSESQTEAIEIFEAPLNPPTWKGILLMTGGTILALQHALAHGTAMNIGGGFHHASRDKGGGFCFINDIAIAIEDARAAGAAHRFAVIDCDLHQGNGTSLIFEHDPDVFTADIHQQRLYPIKARSKLDIGLPDYAGDSLYLEGLGRLLTAVRGFKPEAILYVAGADPFEGDRLGKLSVTKEGLAERDRRVYTMAQSLGAPIATVLGGGYAFNDEDVVDIHLATAKAMLEICSR